MAAVEPDDGCEEGDEACDSEPLDDVVLGPHIETVGAYSPESLPLLMPKALSSFTKMSTRSFYTLRRNL